MIIKRELTVTPILEKKKFLVKSYIEDEIEPEDVKKILDDGQNNLNDILKGLNNMPKEFEARQKYLNEQKELMEANLKSFGEEVSQHARLWCEENRLKNKRAGLPTEEPSFQ